MTICGDYFDGNSYTTKLLPYETGNDSHVMEIRQKIRALRPLLYEFVVVDLISETEKVGMPKFFQTSKSRKYYSSPEQRYLYYVELGIPEHDGKQFGTRIYRKENLLCHEVIYLFNEICVERKKPYLDEWMRNEYLYTDSGGHGKGKIDLSKRYVDILIKYCHGEIPARFADAIVLETFECLHPSYPDFQFSGYFIDICKKSGKYKYLNGIAEKRQADAAFAEAKGGLTCQGRLGKPDLKAAYDYYVHAARIGSLRAGLAVATAIRDGWVNAPDYGSYEKIVKSIYDFYIRNNAAGALCALPEIYLELSHIEEKHGNTEKAISYCLEWKSWNIFQYIDYYEIVEKIILQLYKLTEFNPSDIDLTDLFYILKRPCKVEIYLEDGGFIEVDALKYGDEVIIKCGGRYYRNAVDFFKRCKVNGWHITAYTDKITLIIAEENDVRFTE